MSRAKPPRSAVRSRPARSSSRSGHTPGGRWSRWTARRRPSGPGSATAAGSPAGSGSPAPPAPRSAAGWRRRSPTSPTAPCLASPRRWRPRTRSELIRGPVIASIAGSSVSAARTATTTAIAAIRPIVVTSGMSATASDTSAIVTVPPANTTAPPGGRGRAGDRFTQLQAVVEPAEVPRHDEQRVVDPDAEPDHRGQRRRHRRRPSSRG